MTTFRMLMIALLAFMAAACGTAQSKNGAGYLGAAVQDLTPKLEGKSDVPVHKGARITDVDEDGPADKAGINRGDVIVKFDGHEIGDAGGLIDNVRAAKPGTDVTVEFYRGKDRKNATVTLAKRPRTDAYSFNFNGRQGSSLPHFMPMPRVPARPRIYAFSESDEHGLSTEDLSEQLAEYFEVPGRSGVLVREVEKESDAAKAGFKAGDVIVKAGKRTVEDQSDLRRAMDNAEEGVELAFDIIRKGKPVSLTMKFTGDETSYEKAPFFDRFNDPLPHAHVGLGSLKAHIRVSMDLARIRLHDLIHRVRAGVERL